MFQNASNFKVDGGIFRHVTGNANFYDYSVEQQGFRLLLDNIVTSAFHDAAERGDPPRCHEGTRKVVLAEIKAWIKSFEARNKFLLWLYGPAGAGKTAIAQSIAEACEQEGLLAASFFFSRSVAERNNSSKFIATLAYQLSRCIPETREHLFASIEEDPTIFHRSLSTQMRVLVINPIKAAQPTLRTQIVRFMVIDGIDECGPDGQAQAELIGILGTAVSELEQLPLILLIGSRPEYEIRRAFNKAPLATLTKGMPLDDNYKPHDDIKIYFNAMFQKIRENQLEIGNDLPSQWPSEADVNHLMEKSSGQFIFASTVMKFIDSPRHNPTERLNVILGLSAAGDETPFALLDTLYRFILSSVADRAKVMSILTVLTLATDYRDSLTVDLVEDLLGFGIRTALIDMHALVFVPPPDMTSAIRIHHASMYDFLLDQSRSQEYFIDAGQGDIILSRQWIRAIGNYPRSLSRKYSPPWTAILVDAFSTHCQRIPATKEVADELAALDLRSMLDEVREEMDQIYSSNWVDFFECARQQGKDRVDVYPRLQNEVDTFLLHLISQYPQKLQSHTPALFSFTFFTDVFEILLHVGHPSTAEVERLRRMDIHLLHLQYLSPFLSSVFVDLFKDKTRAGRYYLDGSKFVTLAKEIIELTFPESDEDAHQIRLVQREDNSENDDSDTQYSIDGSDANVRIPLYNMDMSFLEMILSKASQDFDLARLLEDRFCQHRSYHITDDPDDSDRILSNIKGYSERYLKTCGISPYTDRDDVSVFSVDSIVEPQLETALNTGRASELHTLHRPPSLPGLLHSTATGPLVENDLVHTLIHSSPSHTPVTPPDRDNVSVFSGDAIVEPPPESALNPGHASESHTLHRPPSLPGSPHSTAIDPIVENDLVHGPIHTTPPHTSVTPPARQVKGSVWSRLCPCLSVRNVES